MEKQYVRLLDPFLATTKQDVTSFDDKLWRLKVALSRIRGSSYPRARWRWRTVDEILEEIGNLASGFENWKSGKIDDGAKTIQLGAVREVVYQLEDMADDIEYTRRKQHEAKYTAMLYITQKLRLVLKLNEDLLPNLRGIMENFQKEFTAENCIASIRTESVIGSPLQDACVSSPEDGKFEKSNIILKDQTLDSLAERTVSSEQTSEANDIVPESDCHHTTTEDLLENLFKERGNCIRTYGFPQGKGKVTIPVQYIFKDERVRGHFELLVYVRASDRPMSSISPKRTLEESILEFMNFSTVNIVSAECRCHSNKMSEEYNHPKKDGRSNLCQEEDEVVMKENFKSKILLVLENVLEDQLPKLLHLLYALSSGNTESRVVISSKSSEMVKSLSGMIFLSDKSEHGEKEGNYGSPKNGKEKEDNEGPTRKQTQNIEDIIFWRFFRSFALRDEKTGASQEDQDIGKNKKLENIGKRISFHLNIFPLGTKMIAKMLNARRDCGFWAAILEKVNLVVESAKCEHHQLQALLQICYAELPAPLRLCFQYCSLFPSNWTFTSESLVRLWMSQGFLVKDFGSLSSLNKDSGEVETLDDVGKCYFGELHSRSFFEKLTDDSSSYSLHAFVHGFAQVTAGEEFLRIESEIGPEEAMHVRHLSVKSTYLSALYNVDALYSLRTLIIFGPINTAAPDILEKILPRLRTTRTLYLAGCAIERLPELTNDLKRHLRYLSIYDTGIEELPKDFCEFVHLQVLNTLGCRLKKFPQKVTRLRNLRHIDGPTFLTSEMHHVGKFKALQELEEFPVSKSHKIQELGGIKYLRGSIAISNLEKVKYVNAAKAKLHDKGNLNSLKLEWSPMKGKSNMTPRASICGCSLFPDKSRLSAKVLDRLKPHSDLRVLEINWYIGGRSPSWFTADVPANIVDMTLRNCINWNSPPALGKFPKLKTLKLEKWNQLKSFGGDIFPMLEELSLEGMPELAVFYDCPESFPCLKLLTIRNCNKLRGMPLFESSVLAEIYVENVGFHNLPLRTVNQVDPSTSSGAESLTKLTIQNCPNLITVGGIYDDYGLLCLPASLLCLQITGCTQIQYIWFKGDSLLLRTVHMDKISLLKPHFKRLDCLDELVIEDAELPSLEEFPSTVLGMVKKLCLISCEKFEALPEDMTQFSSLKSLRLKKCQKISSLPYLPYNLDELRVDDCPLLKKRYSKNSAGWSMISHVPYKYI
uniref:Uncharacterized protein n=1 Tax=Avena sativa TaxID=4498 RepID=A0ACD5TAS9_AVESA